MNPEEILHYCLTHLEGTVLVESWGEKGIFYNPGNVLKRGVYVLTVKEKDGENDKASALGRSGIYRLNLGLRRPTFARLFGALPKRPTLLPHPVYAWMGWVCVLNPSEGTFEALKPYISEAYAFAQEKFKKRKLPLI